ncbi:MAG: hypothetical protein WCK89_13230 [bacterium]
MKFSWFIFFLTAVVSTAGMYVAAPLARPYITAVFGKREVAQPPPAPQEREPPAMLVEKPDVQPSPVTEAPVPSRPDIPAAVAEEADSAPALNGIYLALRDEKPGWGITSQRTTYYGLDGARLGQVPGGVLLDYRDTRVSSIGNMVECVLLESGTPSAPCLVNSKDVYLFTESYTKLSARQRADLQAYYVFNGKIGVRKTELLQMAAAKNPFFETYNQAYKAYMAHIETAKTLAAKRDRATGFEKSRLEDQLREMKVSETALRMEYDKTHAKFRLWKEQHASELAKLENDPDVLKWTKEMQVLRSSVPGLTF